MPRKYLLLLTVALGVIVLDQWTKYLVVRELTTRFDDRPDVSERLSAMYGAPPAQGFDGLHYRSKRYIEVSPSFFRIRYAENPPALAGLVPAQPARAAHAAASDAELAAGGKDTIEVVAVARRFQALKEDARHHSLRELAILSLGRTTASSGEE